MTMASSILRLTFRGMKGGGGRRMMSTTAIGKISSPWLILPSSSSEAYSKFYSLAEKKVVSIKKEAPPPPWAQGRLEHVGCSHGWVASFNEDNRHTFLSDPITGRHIKLPDLHSLSSYWPDYIILSSSPAAHDCRAIMAYGLNCGVAVCFPAHSSATWIPVCNQGVYHDLVYSTSQNRLFCITNVSIECWDLESPSFVWEANISPSSSESDEEYSSSESDEDDNIMSCSYSEYLAIDEHSGRLFLVVRVVAKQVGCDGSYVKSIALKSGCGGDSYPHKTLSFKVYEIDSKDGKMRLMDGSLDGLAMFVGSNHSFAVPAADLNLRPDSIYFTASNIDRSISEDGENYDIGIFNYMDKKLSSIYYPSHASQISRIAPAMWFTPIPH